MPQLSDFFFKRFYLFIFREGKGGRKWGRGTSMCGCLLRAPYWGHDLQPRHVLWLGIKRETLWFAGWHSAHWATPARAIFNFLRNLQTVFHSNCTILHSCQHCARVSFSLPPLAVLLFLILIILTGVRWYLNMILICISLTISDIEHFFHVPGGFCGIIHGSQDVETTKCP